MAGDTGYGQMTQGAHRDQPDKRRGRGFARAASLLERRIRQAGEARGFAVTRLLTHWPEIVGADLAGVTRPVRVGYGRRAFGATLTVLTTGANAPLLEMRKERLRERVNACYGYAAIAKIHITQTAPEGFAEGQAAFHPATGHAAAAAPTPTSAEARAEAQSVVAPVADKTLREALEALGTNILSRNRT